MGAGHRIGNRLRGDRGFGLVEVVIAVVLLGILGTAVLAIVLQAQSQTVNNRARVAASNLAARELDIVREQFMSADEAPTSLLAEGTVENPNSFGAPGDPLQVDGTAYTVKRSVAWNVTGGDASACDGGSLVKFPTMNVRVEVTWPGMGSTKPVVNTTNLVPAKGIGLPNSTSYVAVKVSTAKGAPNPGRSVNVSGSGESRNGTTDEFGCAVIEVTPTAGSTGKSYRVRLGDSGHVDISGNAAPEKDVGYVKQGQLNSSVKMAYDRAATLKVTIIGGGAQDADVVGSSLGVYQSEFAGDGAITEHILNGIHTTIPGLWPSDYSAFFGLTLPDTYTIVSLGAGESGSLEVPISLAEYEMTSAPPDAQILAVTAGGTECTSPGARQVGNTSGELIPGSWSFFAEHPDYGCSPGPANIELTEGAGNEIEWETTELKIVDAPEDLGPIWAVSNKSVTATCTIPNPASQAILVGNAPEATAELPAGDWYVFVTEADGSVPESGADCESTGLVHVDYGQTTTFTWAP